MSGDDKLPTGCPNARDYFSRLFSLKLVSDRFYGPSQCVLCAHSTIYNALCNGPCVFLHRTTARVPRKL